MEAQAILDMLTARRREWVPYADLGLLPDDHAAIDRVLANLRVTHEVHYASGALRLW